MALHRSPSCLWYFFWVVSLIAAAPLQWAPAVTGQGELEKAWGNEVRMLEGDLLSALPLELGLPIQAGQGACLHVSRSLCTAPALRVWVMWQSPSHPRCLCPCQALPVSGSLRRTASGAGGFTTTSAAKERHAVRFPLAAWILLWCSRFLSSLLSSNARKENVSKTHLWVQPPAGLIQDRGAYVIYPKLYTVRYVFRYLCMQR